MTIQIWRLLVAPPTNFSSKNSGDDWKRWKVWVGRLLLRIVCAASRKQEHIQKKQMFRFWKSVSFKERAERVGEHWCKKSRRVNRHFSTTSSKERPRENNTCPYPWGLLFQACKCTFCSALYFDEDSGCAARFAIAIKFAFGSKICDLLFLFQWKFSLYV